MEDNYDREKQKKDEAEEERNYFQSGKKERKGMSISACNSLVNSTRNLSGPNKQFNFNSEVIQDAANLMSNINEANYSYASQQGIISLLELLINPEFFKGIKTSLFRKKFLLCFPFFLFLLN